MTDEHSDGKLYIDSDWKAEAAQEKERLEAEEQAKPEAGAEAASGFLELVNLLVMQVVMALGGMQGPGGEQIPPNPTSAKLMIDMLGVLEEKTKGNLTDDEKKVLDSALYELRMQYVQSQGGGAAPGPPQG